MKSGEVYQCNAEEKSCVMGVCDSNSLLPSISTIVKAVTGKFDNKK